MPDLDLAVRLRDYARGKGRAALVVSSAWLAREFDVDPRTIAAALRPFGVRPGEVETGVRGYSIAELAGIELPDEAPDVLEGRIPTEPSAMPDDEPPVVVVGRVMWCAVCNSPVVVIVGEGERVNTCHPVGALLDSPLFEPPAGGREMPDGWPGPGWHDLVAGPADLPSSGLNHWSAGMTDEQVAAEVARTAEVPLSTLLTEAEAEVVEAEGVDPDSAIVRLSAGAGHDMTPALRAAGLL